MSSLRSVATKVDPQSEPSLLNLVRFPACHGDDDVDLASKCGLRRRQGVSASHGGCRTCCIRANEKLSAPAMSDLSWLIPHPMQLLCTLRNHCRQGSRNTRYQADAAPYLGRTSTGLDRTSLPGALIRSPRQRWRGGSAEMSSPRTLAVFRLMISWYLVGNWTGNSDGLAPLRIRPT